MCGGIHPAMGSYAAAIQDDLTFEMALDDHGPQVPFWEVA